MRAATRQTLKKVGRRVADLRRARPLTQEQFAEELDVSVRYVQFVEAGAENLTIDTLVKLAAVLKVPLVELFAEPGPPRGPSTAKREGRAAHPSRARRP
jgi:transcriptional regulator with XRE-family HTH domain